MYQLSPLQLLEIWEKGLACTLIERSLLILQNIVSELSYENLTQLTLGERNEYLLLIYQHTFGNLVNCFVKCKTCAESLEFTLNLESFLTLEKTCVAEQRLSINEYDLKFRLLNCADLLAAANENNVEAAHQLLLERCLVSCSYLNQPIEIKQLPEAIINQLITKLQKLDPKAEILLNLNCPLCNTSWQDIFDISAFLWDKLNTEAKRLLNEVHQLATVYGWHEAEILNMSSVRRQYYLERIN